MKNIVAKVFGTIKVLVFEHPIYAIIFAAAAILLVGNIAYKSRVHPILNTSPNVGVPTSGHEENSGYQRDKPIDDYYSSHPGLRGPGDVPYINISPF